MLMQAVISEGTWVPLIVENQEHLRRVDLREIDVATCVMKEQWGRGWRFCREVETRAKMEVRETAFIMEDTSGLLDRLYPELVKVGSEGVGGDNRKTSPAGDGTSRTGCVPPGVDVVSEGGRPSYPGLVCQA